MATRIYKVTSQSGTYLVRASTRNQAIAHIAKDEIVANVATQDDIVSLMQDGRKVIELKESE
jgi:uncharacterized protein YacL (UPF0231 family)